MMRQGRGINRWFYGILGTIVMLCAGCIYAWGVFSAVIGAEFPQWSRAGLSMTFTVTMIFFCIATILAGALAAKVSWKIWMAIGGCFFLIGLSITGSVHTLGMLYIGFGIFCGFGTGLVYSSTVSTVTKWFTDKLGLISGILLMGFGFGSFLVGKIFSFIAIGAGGWRNGCRYMGIVMCIITIVGAIFLQRPGADAQIPAALVQAKRAPVKGMEAKPAVMMKRPAFWCFYLWSIVFGVVGLTMISQGGGICGQIQPAIQMGAVSTLVGLISIFNGAGRVIYGRIYDVKGHMFTMIMVVINTFVGQAILLAAISARSIPILAVAFIFLGLAYGGLPPLNSALISEFYGREHYGVNFPVVMSHLLFASVGGTLSGKLFDMTGSYIATIIMTLIFTCVGLVLLRGVKKP